MEFNNINTGLSYSCIERDMNEDTENVYLRKIFSNDLSEDDFKSHYEKGLRSNRSNKTSICIYRGVSIQFLKNDDSNKDDIISFFKKNWSKTKSLSPKIAEKLKFYCSFKFLTNAGLIWNTSRRGNLHHRTFMKSDEFNFNIHIRKIRIDTF